MKILIVSHLWPRNDYPFLGIFVKDQAAALKKWCEVAVCAPVDLTLRAEELTAEQIIKGSPKYHRRSHPDFVPFDGDLPRMIPYRPLPLRQAFATSTARRLSKALECVDLNGIDVVHAHTLFPDGLACAQWLKDKPTPLVVTVHGSDLYSTGDLVHRALVPLLKRSDKLITVSEALSRQLLEIEGPAEKIVVIPNGFTTDLFNDVDINSERGKRIAFLGRLNPVKRVDLLLRALEFCPPEVTLDIAGAGDQDEPLKALAMQLQLGDRVRFVGTVERNQVPEFLSSHELLCLVSEREGWPTVIFEAFACGTPVLATAIGGMPEAISSTDLGAIVPADISPRDLATAITATLEKKWDRQAIRDHALKQSWDDIAERLYQLYAQITCSPELNRAALLRSREC